MLEPIGESNRPFPLAIRKWEYDDGKRMRASDLGSRVRIIIHYVTSGPDLTHCYAVQSASGSVHVGNGTAWLPFMGPNGGMGRFHRWRFSECQQGPVRAGISRSRPMRMPHAEKRIHESETRKPPKQSAETGAMRSQKVNARTGAERQLIPYESEPCRRAKQGSDCCTARDFRAGLEAVNTQTRCISFALPAGVCLNSNWL